jgi:hypothetical protein
MNHPEETDLAGCAIVALLVLTLFAVCIWSLVG